MPKRNKKRRTFCPNSKCQSGDISYILREIGKERYEKMGVCHQCKAEWGEFSINPDVFYRPSNAKGGVVTIKQKLGETLLESNYFGGNPRGS